MKIIIEIDIEDPDRMAVYKQVGLVLMEYVRKVRDNNTGHGNGVCEELGMTAGPNLFARVPGVKLTERVQREPENDC